MNHWFKRSVCALLTLLMVLTMMPAVAIFASAAELGGLSDSNIGLEYTGATNKGTVTWSAAANGVSGAVYGQLNGPFYKAESSTLTITNKKASAVKLTFNYSVTTANGSVVIGGTTIDVKEDVKNGTYTAELAGGESLTITLSVTQRNKTQGENKAIIQISNLSMTSDSDATTTFAPSEGGSYTVTDANGKTVPIAAATQMTQHSSKTYTLTATAAEGYLFYGWYNVTTDKYFAYTETTTFQTDSDCTVKPVFVTADSAVFQAGGAKFTDLGAAAAYAKENNITTVVLVSSGVLSGEHTIPAGVTLLIPFDDAYTCHTDVPGITGVVLKDDGMSVLEATAWVQPYAYSTLTLAAGAKINVDGAISVGGEHYAGNGVQGSDVSHCGAPSGPVGFIKMETSSEIVINSDASLYAWGYVIGDGTVTAKNGATVRENMQITDFRGGTASLSIALSDTRIFPISQYYVQNVETKLVLEYGSTEYIHTAVYVPTYAKAASVGVMFIGEGGMFRAAEGGSIVKEYLPESDRLQIDVIGGGSINSLGVDMGAVVSGSLDTSAFILPITNNITINMLSGVTSVNQDMALLPGAEVIIAEGAELVVSENNRYVVNEDTGEGKWFYGCNLYIYDADQWTSDIMIDLTTGEIVNVAGGNFVFANRKFAPVAYSPSRTYNRTDADIKDVVLDINGTLTINGFVYTTESGADIRSSEGTGVVKMNSGLAKDYAQAMQNGESFYTMQAIQMDVVYMAPIVVTSLKLHNGSGNYTTTDDAVAGDTYYWNADCNMWVKNSKSGHVAGEPTVEETDKVVCCKNCGKELSRKPINPDVLLGDANGDGDISVLDAMLIAQYIVGDIGEAGMTVTNADVNHDGDISVLDAMLIAQYIVGDIQEF